MWNDYKPIEIPHYNNNYSYIKLSGYSVEDAVKIIKAIKEGEKQDGVQKS